MAIWLVYLLISVCTYRATRFVIEDTIPPWGPAREWLLNWWEPDAAWRFDPSGTPTKHVGARPHWGLLGRSLRYLFSCPWCMSVWVGSAVTYAFSRLVSVPLPIAAVVVASAVTGLLSQLEEFLGRGRDA